MKQWQQWLVCFLLLVMCLICREGMTSRDGVVFMQLGELVNGGDYSAVLRHPQHPLLPFLIGFLMKLGVSSLMAGLTISILSVIVLLWAIKNITELIYGEEESRWSFFFLVTNPFLLSAGTNILADTPYWAMLYMAIFYLIRFSIFQRDKEMLWSGLFFGAAYCTRPEALVVAACVFVYVAYMNFMNDRNQKALLWGVLGLSPFILLLTTLYYSMTKEIHLSMKVDFLNKMLPSSVLGPRTMGRDLDRIAGLDVDNSVHGNFGQMSFVEEFSSYFEHFVSNLFMSGLVVIVIVSCSLIWKKRAILFKKKLLLCLLVAQLLVVHLKWFESHYLSSRHLMPSVLLITIWSGPIFVWLKEKWSPRVVNVFVLIVILFGLGKSSHFYKSEEKRKLSFGIHQKDLGEFLKGRPEKYVVAPDSRIAWHAGRKTFLNVPLVENSLMYFDKVSEKFPGNYIVVLNRRRPHNTLTFDEIDKGLIVKGWQRYKQSGKMVSYIMSNQLKGRQ